MKKRISKTFQIIWGLIGLMILVWTFVWFNQLSMLTHPVEGIIFLVAIAAGVLAFIVYVIISLIYFFLRLHNKK